MLYTTIPKFLGAELNRELLDFADASRSNFLDTGVGVDSEVHTATRVSKRLSDLREYREKIERRVLEKVPELLEQLRDRKSTRLNSSHIQKSRMPSSA